MSSDWHIGIGQENSIWLNTTIKLAKEICSVAHEHNIEYIVILGDIFDNKKVITQKSLAVAVEIFAKILADHKILLLKGNHDTYYKNQDEPNWLSSLFSKYENITLVTSAIYNIENLYFVPWGKDIKTIPDDVYLFGHFEINNFEMNDKFISYNATFHSNMFSRFKHVYTGHFHLSQSRNNITYLGTPFQHRFDEVKMPRGYYILDTVNDDREFIEFLGAPKFEIMYTDNIVPEKVFGNIVKLVFKKDYGSIKNHGIIEKAISFGPLILSTDTTLFSMDDIKCEELDEPVSIKTPEEMLHIYVEQTLPKRFNQTTMKKITNAFLKELNDRI
jgi:DNA repair exonuclease SbcCD nuclease subunit